MTMHLIENKSNKLFIKKQDIAIIDHFEEILKCNPNCDASGIDPDFNAFLDKFYQNHQDLFKKLENL